MCSPYKPTDGEYRVLNALGKLIGYVFLVSFTIAGLTWLFGKLV